ncbi:hypothetical protein NL676_032336 [Syzygium grande]|nr:hypothetical protein NL676_032336 [Syzygium grande]
MATSLLCSFLLLRIENSLTNSTISSGALYFFTVHMPDLFLHKLHFLLTPRTKSQQPPLFFLDCIKNHYFPGKAMAVAFYDLGSASGLKKLDEYLLTRSYITGFQASKDDITVNAALPKPPSSEFVNVSRWYNHVEALLRISGVDAEGCGVIVEGFAPITEEALATPPVADTKAAAAEDDDDDDVDLFGEETEEEKKAAEERAAAVKASGKKKESGKSSVLLDVKPWDDETDMKLLEEAVRSVQMEGLLWGASKLVPVGYGIKKLQIMMTIVDDLVAVTLLLSTKYNSRDVSRLCRSGFSLTLKLDIWCPISLSYVRN